MSAPTNSTSTSTSTPSQPAVPNFRPKALIFDLLTALLDSWTLWDASVPASHSPSTEAKQSAGRHWRLRYLTLTYTQGSYVPYESLVRQSAADTGLPTSAPESLVHNWDKLRTWPDVAETLLAAKRAGVKLAVVTNCSRELGEKAVRGVEVEVDEFAKSKTQSNGEGEGKEGFKFDAVVTAEESGWYKPARPAYEAILPKLGCEREEVLFVAGSAGDVQGATDARLRVVWHNQTGLPRVGGAVPEREGRTLGETLSGFWDESE